MTQSFSEFADVLGPNPSQEGQGTPAPSSFRVLDGAGKESAIAGEAYEGASRFSRELAMWQPRNRTADQDILPAKRISDARIRDILRNDAYVQSGAALHKDNIVGGAFLLNAKPHTKVLFGKADDIWEEEFQEEVEAKFTLWAESDANWVDASRRNNFTMLVRQAIGTYLACGEVIASIEWSREERDFRPFNTSVRMVDVDRLSTPPTLKANPYIIGGVEVDQRHIPIAYHIRKAHPRDVYYVQNYEWARIDAKKPWGRPLFIHLFEQMRAGQTRGMSDMAAGIRETHMAREFRDVMLQNAVVNATYAAVIESDIANSAEVFAKLGAGADSIDEAISELLGAQMSAISEYAKGADQLKLGGVRIPHLLPGSKLHMQPAGQGGPLGTEFEQSLLRNIAALLGVSYEQLSKDYTETNYSSARAAQTETWKFMVSRKKIIADRFANIVYRNWLEEALNKGVITSMPRRMGVDTAWLYQPLAMEAITRCEWIGASRGQIDELKETQAAVLRLKYGLSTYEQERARLGGDWRADIRQIAREKKAMEDAGLPHVSSVQDNSINAASGEKDVSESGNPSAHNEFADILGGELNGSLSNDFRDATHKDEEDDAE